MTARLFIFIALLIKQIYDLITAHASEIQRKKPLPEEVADIYDPERYNTFLAFTADKKKLRNKYKIIMLLIDTIFIFSPIYCYIEQISNGNPYGSFFITYAIIWLISLVTDTIISYKVTFGLLEKYGLNKKDKKEFAKDEILNQALNLILMVLLSLVIIFVGEHLAVWTDNFSVGLNKIFLICGGIVLVAFVVVVIAQLLSYAVLKKEYVFTPMEDGELKEKIYMYQEGSKKKVKKIYVYNESKKTTTKNAFLLKLLYFHREFCIADNFMNENAEDELLGVLSHEIGHLKHKKNIKNYVNYAISILSVLFLVYIIANPQICLMINRWIRDSFNISTNNYYLIITVYEYIVSPVLFFKGIYDSYVSRCEEYEADLEAVKNGYGEALIKTFKTLSSDQLVDVNPHPFIEFTEYNHPGMYQRIRAIKKAID